MSAASLERQVYHYKEFESDDSWLFYWSIENTWNTNGVAIKLVVRLGQKQPPDEMRYLSKFVFLEISQNSQENTYTMVSFLIKLQAGDLIKKETLVLVFSERTVTVTWLQ